LTVRIAPSILAADFMQLGRDVARAEAGGAEFIHVDVMDGHFVPNLSMGTPVVEALARATRLPLDVHLMIDSPDRYLEMFVKAGATVVNVHVEVVADLAATVGRIHAFGAKAGVAINPDTPLARIAPVLASIDHLLVMSVHPGFTGQRFLPGSVARVAEARALLDAAGARAEVVVDGGVDLGNAGALAEAGATVLVAGASVFHTPDPAEAVRALRRAGAPAA
jgi:ribulose-phosphate 3-epimerase